MGVLHLLKDNYIPWLALEKIETVDFEINYGGILGDCGGRLKCAVEEHG